MLGTCRALLLGVLGPLLVPQGALQHLPKGGHDAAAAAAHHLRLAGGGRHVPTPGHWPDPGLGPTTTVGAIWDMNTPTPFPWETVQTGWPVSGTLTVSWRILKNFHAVPWFPTEGRVCSCLVDALIMTSLGGGRLSCAGGPGTGFGAKRQNPYPRIHFFYTDMNIHFFWEMTLLTSPGGLKKKSALESFKYESIFRLPLGEQRDGTALSQSHRKGQN